MKLRRDRTAELAHLRLDIVGAGTSAEAHSVVTGTVHAIVLSVRQLEENGLVLAKNLRTKFGPDVYILVHGPTSPPASPADRATIAANHGVDRWMANAIEPDGLLQALLPALEARYAPRARAASAEDVDDEPTWRSMLTGPSLDKMKRLMTRDLTKRKS